MIDQVGTSAAHIAAIEQGRRRASARTMSALARALGEEPTVFAEYRLAVAREALDEARIGLDAALSNLEKSGLNPSAEGNI